MRKLGIKVLIFGVVFLVLIKVIGHFDNIDRETSTNPNITRIANAHHFDSLDILFVGNSASYSGIDPAYFDSIGLHTYNLSVAAAGPYFYEMLINDYNGSVNKKPKAVFVLLMPYTFSEKADDFYEIGIHRYLGSPVSNEKIVQTFNDWQTYPQLLLKSFQKGIKNLVFMQKASVITLSRQRKDKGFYRSDEITSAEKEKKELPAYAALKTISFDNNKFNYLEQLVNTLKRQGITVVFFSLPGNRSNGFFSATYLADYQRASSKLKAGWDVIDISSLSLDNSAFRNVDHLNTHGASVVSQVLLNKIIQQPALRSLFKLPDSFLNKIKTNE